MKTESPLFSNQDRPNYSNISGQDLPLEKISMVDIEKQQSQDRFDEVTKIIDKMVVAHMDFQEPKPRPVSLLLPSGIGMATIAMLLDERTYTRHVDESHLYYQPIREVQPITIAPVFEADLSIFGLPEHFLDITAKPEPRGIGSFEMVYPDEYRASKLNEFHLKTFKVAMDDFTYPTFLDRDDLPKSKFIPESIPSVYNKVSNAAYTKERKKKRRQAKQNKRRMK